LVVVLAVDFVVVLPDPCTAAGLDVFTFVPALLGAAKADAAANVNAIVPPMINLFILVFILRLMNLAKDVLRRALPILTCEPALV